MARKPVPRSNDDAALYLTSLKPSSRHQPKEYRPHSPTGSRCRAPPHPRRPWCSIEAFPETEYWGDGETVVDDGDVGQGQGVDDKLIDINRQTKPYPIAQKTIAINRSKNGKTGTQASKPDV
ncbi:uncharacterized protein MCYG_06230 [Microsporum canis CBS 113480]|uniref:Uncharacterized protein n=1 Tax=Arthroderma otae (strain ATCC MYA-4605 / CBS 113480) TaxID=554155 RepID=C5FU27_ARTOC|nr:uncharacterized protein MCYG_06230 [Microsporum canis CBS 113480]EEQ33411.1 predicted protein [Microsporum canis CBS 113480]